MSKLLNKKINRNDINISSESDNILSLAKRDEQADKYFQKAIIEKDSKKKTSIIRKSI